MKKLLIFICLVNVWPLWASKKSDLISLGYIDTKVKSNGNCMGTHLPHHFCLKKQKLGLKDCQPSSDDPEDDPTILVKCDGEYKFDKKTCKDVYRISAPQVCRYNQKEWASKMRCFQDDGLAQRAVICPEGCKTAPSGNICNWTQEEFQKYKGCNSDPSAIYDWYKKCNNRTDCITDRVIYCDRNRGLEMEWRYWCLGETIDFTVWTKGNGHNRSLTRPTGNKCK